MSNQVVVISEFVIANQVVPIPRTNIVGKLLIRSERCPVKHLELLVDERFDGAGFCKVLLGIIVEAVVSHIQLTCHPVMGQYLGKTEKVLLVRGVNELVEV